MLTAFHVVDQLRKLPNPLNPCQFCYRHGPSGGITCPTAPKTCDSTGAWRADAELTKRLGGRGVVDELEFRADAKVIETVPKAIALLQAAMLVPPSVGPQYTVAWVPAFVAST